MVWVSLLRLIWFFLQTGVLQLNFLVRSSYSSFIRDSSWVLIYTTICCDKIPGVRSMLLRVSRICRSSARQVTHWSYPFITSFYAFVTILKHCMIRMWFLTCGFWEVDDDVEPIALLLSNPGSYFNVMVILPCYARRRGLGLSVSMTDVRLLING